MPRYRILALPACWVVVCRRAPPRTRAVAKTPFTQISNLHLIRLYVSAISSRHGYRGQLDEQQSGTDRLQQVNKQRPQALKERPTSLARRMAVLHQYDYIFAIGMLFAFLDAWNIGANDVANSFATSVSSRSLTMKQAMLIATVMEFAGAVLVGSRVADTIRSKILSVSAFEQQPAILMLGMMCALVGSSTWLTVATKMGLPVSTTLVHLCPCLSLTLTIY